MGMFFHDRGEAPPERPTDPEVRRANLRRIGLLFKPYWRRLSGLLALIVLSAGSIAGFLGRRPAWLRAQRYLMGTTLAGLALRIAAERRAVVATP